MRTGLTWTPCRRAHLHSRSTFREFSAAGEMLDSVECCLNLPPPVDAGVKVEIIEPSRERVFVQQLDDVAGGSLAVRSCIGDEDPRRGVGVDKVDRLHLDVPGRNLVMTTSQVT